MARRLATILLVLLVAAGVLTTAVGAGPDYTVPVLAQTVDASNPGDVPAGMTVVFLPPAGDGFSDGGDGPGGLEWVIGLGFSDGGDTPDGYVAVAGEQAGDRFWRNSPVPSSGALASFLKGSSRCSHGLRPTAFPTAATGWVGGCPCC